MENTPSSRRLCQLGLGGRTRTESVLLWWLHVFPFASVKEGNIIKVRGRHKCPCGCFCSRSCSSSFLRVFAQVINRKVEQKKKKSNLKKRLQEMKGKSAWSRQTLLPVLLTVTEQPLTAGLALEESRCRQSLCLKSRGCHLPVMETWAGGLLASAGPRFFG